MSRKIAVKRLTKSDLTFFIWHFANENAGNQKAINLNADVFIERLYPTLPDRSHEHGDRFPLDLDIYGPAGAPRLNLQRKIMKGAAYKNWRLNGEFVQDEPDRFKALKEGDLVVMEFDGYDYPTSARMVFLAQNDPLDASAHGVITKQMAGARMSFMPDFDFAACALLGGKDREHPLSVIGLDSDLSEAAMGNAAAAHRVMKRRSGRIVSTGDLARMRQHAEAIGAAGEDFVEQHLSQLQSAGVIHGYEWTSKTNAIAPFDFQVFKSDGTIAQRIDAKSTAGEFDQPLHVSFFELQTMAQMEIPYVICRVFSVRGRQASIRVSEPLNSWACKLLEWVSKLPSDVRPDSFSVRPGSLKFGQNAAVNLGGEDD